MAPTERLIHIVADFGTAGDTCAQALALQALLAPLAEVRCWSTGTLPAAGWNLVPVSRVVAFGGDCPAGGTLLLVGPRQPLSPWLERSRARRIVILSDSGDGDALFRLLASVRASSLPEPELAFSCSALAMALGINGRLLPPLVDLPRLHRPTFRRPVVAMPPLRHPALVALARSWALAGLDVLLVGARPADVPPGAEGIAALTVRGPLRSADLLATDIVFLPETSGVQPWPHRLLPTAMAAGCAVVTARRGAEDWLIEGESGLVATSPDEAMVRVSSLATDAGLRRRLGEGARTQAERLSGPAARSALAGWLFSA